MEPKESDHKQSEEAKQSRWGFRGMTVRDWLQLLVVPLALVVISLLFAAQQDQRQQHIEDQRAQQAQKIENQRAEAERELAKQSAQDEALQAYLDQMSSLLLEKDLRDSKKDSEVRTLARARTVTVLGRLDPDRKTQVMQFLVEAKLVQSVDDRDPIIALSGADLNGADLGDANLSGAKLSEAKLSEARLDGANLSDAKLNKANMSGAFLLETNMSGARLFVTNMSDADLGLADLSDAYMAGTKLKGAILQYADLSDAFLISAKLEGAKLEGANLKGARLNYARLNGARLSGANLEGATGPTNEELQQQTKALKKTTMPNGQKYEDWLKDRQKRQQDE